MKSVISVRAFELLELLNSLNFFNFFFLFLPGQHVETLEEAEDVRHRLLSGMLAFKE